VPDNCGKASAWHVQDIDVGEGIYSALVADKKFSVLKRMDFYRMNSRPILFNVIT